MQALILHAIALSVALVVAVLILALRAGRPHPYLVIPGWVLLVASGGALLYFLVTGATPGPRAPAGFPIRLAFDYYCWGLALGVVVALGRVVYDSMRGLRATQRKQ